VLAVGRGQLSAVAFRLCPPWCDGLERCTTATNKAQRAVIEYVNTRLPFMHEPMVEGTEEHQIRELGRPALRPMVDVMAVDVTLVRTAREPTTAITRLQGLTQGRRDTVGFTSDIERFALLVFKDRHDAGIASESPRGLGGNRRAILELAFARLIAFQRLGIDMNDDLVLVASSERGHAVSDEALGHHRERIGTTVRERNARRLNDKRIGLRRFRGNVFGREFIEGEFERLHYERTDLGGKSGFQQQRTIAVVRPAHASRSSLSRFARELGGLLGPTIAAHQFLDVLSGAVQRDGEEALFGGGSTNPGDGTNLRVTEFATGPRCGVDRTPRLAQASGS
jgi:hypothetical protein